MVTDDRFKKISNNYGDLFTEVFAEQGMDYEELEKSIFDTVSKTQPDFKEMPILDIGIGDGVSSELFVRAGCTKLTGIDLNQEMLDAAKVKFGDLVHLHQMNAVDMSKFEDRKFEIIVSGATIHNIPKIERVKFWKEILRLDPKIIVLAEKIKDPDIIKHQADYDREVGAIKKVYGEIHNLKDAEKEWLDHYEYDDREALYLDEINEMIGNKYTVSVVFEMGLYKTVLAVRTV